MDALKLWTATRLLRTMLTLAGMAQAATYYVDVNNFSPAPPYTNWVTAAQQIQQAVDCASAGDTVLVTDGVYKVGQRVTPGYASLNRVVILGNITVRSVNGPDVTVIEGQALFGVDAVRCVFMTNGVLIGFTLTNGYTRDSGDYYLDLSGGGINMYNSGAIVSNCTISGNFAAYWGGGTADGTVNNCTISGNSAGYGGGTSRGTVSSCTISGNSARDSGGGTSYSTVNNCMISSNRAGRGGGTYFGTVNNCTISGNSADNGGGTHDCTVNNCTISGNSAGNGGGTYRGTVSNCTISDNRAGHSGGGTCFGTVNSCLIVSNTANTSGGGTYNSTLNNCTISGNSAEGGGGTYQGAVRNSIVWGNTAAVSNNYYAGAFEYSCSTPAPGGAGNIGADPQFIGAGNYELSVSSPCINAGTNAYAPLPYDLAGNLRIIEDIVDMGCYEYVPEPAGVMTVVLCAVWYLRTGVRRNV